MKKNTLLYAVIILGIFTAGCSANNTKSIQTESTVKQSDTVKKEDFNSKIGEIKKAITNHEPIEGNELSEIKDFITANKDRDEIKNDLTNFISDNFEKFLNTGEQNDDAKLRLTYVMGHLWSTYPDNKRVHDLYIAYANKEAGVDNAKKKEEEKKTQETTQTVSNNLKSADGNLELISYSVKNGDIVGTIKNNSNKQYRYVEVNINLYDANGNQVDSTIANVNNLEPYKSWNFSAVVVQQNVVKSYKIISIYGTQN